MVPAQFFVFLQLLVTVFLVVLLWCLYARLRKQEFFRWWAWAWTVSAGQVASGGLILQLGPVWSLSKGIVVLLGALFGCLQVPLLLFGAWSLSSSRKPTQRWLNLGMGLGLTAGCLSFLLAFHWREQLVISFVLRSAPRALVLSAALFYCAAVFFRQWRSTQSTAAAISGCCCLFYGVNQALYSGAFAALVIGDRLGRLQSIFDLPLRAGFLLRGLDIVYVCGICLGLVFLLVEEHRRAEQAFLVSVIGSYAMAGNNIALQAEITERKEAEEGLRNLAFRVIHIQEEERARIARELHDDVSQRLGVLTFRLDQVLEDSLQTKSASSRELIALATIAHQLCSDIQHVTLHLHPSHVEIAGLVSAVSGFCVEYGRQNAFEVEFAHSLVPDTLPQEVKLCLYRVAQEAVRNAQQHSGSGRVRVELSGAGGGIRLLVSDTGKGFELASVRAQGLGLVSMAERVKSLGGQFRVQSRLGDGTSVEASISLAKSAAASAN